jgi:hypothetical protein
MAAPAHDADDVAELRTQLAALAPRQPDPRWLLPWPGHGERPRLAQRPDASAGPLWNARRDRAHPPMR